MTGRLPSESQLALKTGTPLLRSVTGTGARGHPAIRVRVQPCGDPPGADAGEPSAGPGVGLRCGDPESRLSHRNRRLFLPHNSPPGSHIHVRRCSPTRAHLPDEFAQRTRALFSGVPAGTLASTLYSDRETLVSVTNFASISRPSGPGSGCPYLPPPSPLGRRVSC